MQKAGASENENHLLFSFFVVEKLFRAGEMLFFQLSKSGYNRSEATLNSDFRLPTSAFRIKKRHPRGVFFIS